MDSWLVTLIGIQMAFTAVVIYLVFQSNNAKAQRRAELQARLIERFDTAEELVRFLATDEGKQLMSNLAPPRSNPTAASATGFKAALILLFLALAFLLLNALIADSLFMVPGLLCMALSAGIGAAAFLGLRLAGRSEPMDPSEESLLG